MQTIAVKDLMVPIKGYATVPESANLHEAILALEKTQEAFDPTKHKHRAILVLDGSGNVVGKLTIFNILMALEPKYSELEAAGVLSSSGYSPNLIKDLLEDHVLWSEPLASICSRAPEMNVRDIMEAPGDGVYIDENAALAAAIHQLVLGRHQSLLVTRSSKVVGVLRLSDVFAQICDKIKTCEF